MATRAEYLGVRKAEMPGLMMFTLAILAGAFIGLGAMFATIVIAGASGVLPYGVIRLLAGSVFCLGLILVVVGGAELFTGNNLIVMAWASGKVTSQALLRNWIIVYIGNFAGSLATAAVVFISKQYLFGNGSVGQTALGSPIPKSTWIHPGSRWYYATPWFAYDWMTFSARSTPTECGDHLPNHHLLRLVSKHSIANMYFIPIGLLIKS
jgi:hypothetical protein